MQFYLFASNPHHPERPAPPGSLLPVQPVPDGVPVDGGGPAGENRPARTGHQRVLQAQRGQIRTGGGASHPQAEHRPPDVRRATGRVPIGRFISRFKSCLVLRCFNFFLILE